MNRPIYRFTVWSDGKGRDFARCGDLEATSKASAIASLARSIVALDCVPDGEVHVYDLAGRHTMTVTSLHWYATMTVNADARLVKWQPHPMAMSRAA